MSKMWDAMGMRYFGDWYGKDVEWFPYYYEKTEDDPSFWPDDEWRIQPECVIGVGGFSMDWALENGVRKVGN